MNRASDELKTLIAASRTRRAVLRKTSSWVAQRRAAGEKHELIVEQINQAGWTAKFGKPLTVQMFRQERSVLARQQRGGTLLPPKRSKEDRIVDAVIERLRSLPATHSPAAETTAIVVPSSNALRPRGFQKAPGADEVTFDVEFAAPKPPAPAAAPEHFDFHADAARTRHPTKKE